MGRYLYSRVVAHIHPPWRGVDFLPDFRKELEIRLQSSSAHGTKSKRNTGALQLYCTDFMVVVPRPNCVSTALSGMPFENKEMDILVVVHE